MQRKRAKLWVTPALGVLLLIGLLGTLETEKLVETLQRASIGWFLAALMFAIVTNLICAQRWRYLAARFRVEISYARAVSLYGQALAANSVLPGGVVGGDVWRALQLSRSADPGHKDIGPLSVFLDRLSGFWGLALASLAGALTWISTREPQDPLSTDWLLVHITFLGLIILAPFLMSLLVRPLLSIGLALSIATRLQPLLQLGSKLASSAPLLLHTLPYSLCAQLFTQLALWSCLKAVGLEIPTLLLLGVSSGILLASVVPVAVGGFGPRELGMVAFLAPFGFSSEGLVAGSILFGLTATIQGAMSLLFFGPIKQEQPPKNTSDAV